MKQIVFNAQTVYLLDDEPNWSVPVEAEFALFRDRQSGLTHRDARRPYSETLRTTLSYTSEVRRANLRALQAALRSLTTEPVIVPFWPAIQYWQDRAAAPLSGGLKIAWKADRSQYEAFTDVEPGWAAAGDFFAPALYGFLTPSKSPVTTIHSLEFKVLFNEASPAAYALQPAAVAWTAGPQPGGYAAAPKLFPFRPDRRGLSEQLSVSIDRTELGFTRIPDSSFYPHAAEHLQEALYTLVDAQPFQMLRFFQEISAPGASFWAPSALHVAQLTQAAAANATVLNVEDTSAVNIGDYVALFNGVAVVARKIIAPKTANTLTLNAAAGFALAAGSCLFPLCLARLDRAALKMQWQRPGAATCSMPWTEVPAEYIIAADETLGVTQGRLPTRLILVQFTRDYGNGTIENFYFTSFEKNVDWNGHTWLTGVVDKLGDMTKSLNLGTDSLDIPTIIKAGNPMVDELAMRSEAMLTATVRFADFDGVNLSNVEVIFTGNADAPRREGNKIIAKCKMGSALLDTQFPFFLKGKGCRHVAGSAGDGTHLISVGCTGPDVQMLKARWKFTATVAAPVSSAFPNVLHLATLVGAGAGAAASLAAAAVFLNWFSGGWIEWGAGAALQIRDITGSTVPAAGAITLNLNRYFGSLPNVGDPVSFFPSCDGRAVTCKAYDANTNPEGKFNNYLNFGGDPLTPAGNPSKKGQINLGLNGAKK
jgi:hypothetical protein